MEIPAILTSTDARWHPHAACAHDGPDRYYAQPHPAGLCAACPAAEPCLWAALALEGHLGYRYGTWGGASAQRRRRIAASLPSTVDYTRVYVAVVDDWTARPLPRPAGGLAA